MVVIAHLIGCAFYWIASAWNNGPDVRRWYNRDPTLGTSVPDLYVSSLYWAMTTVRYLDIQTVYVFGWFNYDMSLVFVLFLSGLA